MNQPKQIAATMIASVAVSPGAAVCLIAFGCPASSLARRPFSLSAKLLEIPEVEGFAYQCHRGLGRLSGAVRAVGQGIADQPHLDREVHPPLADRVEEGVERRGELLFDFDVSDGAAAIPVLEIRHLLTVG